MLAPVIAGVDGSAESLTAAAWAAREAQLRGRGLRLVHVWDRHPRPGEAQTANAAQRYLARRTLRRVQEHLLTWGPDLRADDELVEGPVVPALLRAADQADLLVLGSRGPSAFTGFLAGSVTLGVVARATRPVVLVRAGGQAADEDLPGADERTGTRAGHADVVLGVDVDAPSEAAVEFGFEAARLRRARLRVVSARQTPPPFDDLLPDTDGHRAVLTEELGRWQEKYPEVEVMETHAEGRPQSVLARAACGACLLVVGHHLAERPMGPHTGPVTHAVIRHAGCPVAVVPHE